MGSPLEADRDRLVELFGAHESTRGLLVTIRRNQLIVARQEPSLSGDGLDFDDRLRLTPLGPSRYGLSVLRHTGRWERTPFAGTLDHIVHAIVTSMQHLVADWP